MCVCVCMCERERVRECVGKKLLTRTTKETRRGGCDCKASSHVPGLRGGIPRAPKCTNDPQPVEERSGSGRRMV